MRLLVTGAAGFMGSHLEAKLAVRAYDTVGTVRWPIPDSIRRRAALSKGGENAN